MNTKKIMALTLAALMTAGSAVPAFADAANKDQALVFAAGNTAYEEDDNGVRVVDQDGQAPGDTIYFRLTDGTAKPGESITDKERDRIKVYADWKLGKDYIEEINVVYEKGNFQSSDNQQVTGYEYTLNAPGSSLNGKTLTVDGAKKPTGYNFATELDGTQILTDALVNDYTVTSGYVIGGTYYTNDATGVKAYLKDKGWTEGDSSVSDATLVGTNYGTYTSSGGGVTIDTTYMVKTGSPNYFVKYGSVDMAELLTAIGADLSGAGLDAASEWTEVTASAPIYTLLSGIQNGKVESSDIISKEQAMTNLKNTVSGYSKADEQYGAKNGYTYWVEVKTKEYTGTKEQDVVGTLYLGTSKSSAEKNGDSINIDLTLSNRNMNYYNPTPVEDEATIEPDTNGAVKFASDAEEVTIYFGSNEDAWFTFNAKGQSDLNFAYTLDFNREIADLFPKANIDFITWKAQPAANRTGDLYIPADADSYIYEVTEDGVKEVNGAKYDEDEEAWHIRTRKLTAYAISDRELDTSVKLDNDSSSSTSSSGTNTDGNKANPDTGR